MYYQLISPVTGLPFHEGKPVKVLRILYLMNVNS